jgi:hypothetical protein
MEKVVRGAQSLMLKYFCAIKRYTLNLFHTTSLLSSLHYIKYCNSMPSPAARY